ncbi:MAG: HPr family phosphocarrier protein [Candidatus Omnitrophica bacterium]|nr:HPr family phosphocarrier protein [Candidatus Omnitrophota bacterium]
MTARREVVVKNRTGLHARPAAVFVQLANKFESDIMIEKDDQKVNGKSIMGILMLAAERGARIVVEAVGEDAEQAVNELSEVLSQEIELDIA